MRHATILVVDDDQGFRKFVADTLSSAGFVAIEASDADAAMSTARKHPPDAAVLDVALPGVSGFGLCRELRDQFGEGLTVVFVSGERTDPVDRATGILVGGDDYLVKPIHPDELVARLRRILERAHMHGASSAPSELTEREIEVLQLVAEGASAADVASSLVISRKTVSSHMQRIFTKLDVHTRAQAVAVAYAAGLIHVSSGIDEVEGHLAASNPVSTSVPSARTS
jgi:two-component system, NarL family, nitrate/nitrite response regulator NarL